MIAPINSWTYEICMFNIGPTFVDLITFHSVLHLANHILFLQSLCGKMDELITYALKIK
jgi:hypothetical protein